MGTRKGKNVALEDNKFIKITPHLTHAVCSCVYEDKVNDKLVSL
jgi:hypothetical protein